MRGKGSVKFGLVALSVLVAVLLSCTSSKSDKVTSGDELARANYLIEQHQTSEAIYILAERLKREPRDIKARVLLASAYAARAGFELSQYKDFAGEILKWNEPKNDWPDNANPNDLANQIGLAAWRIELVVRAFDAIPDPAGPAAYDDLLSALQVLDEGGPLNGGASLYRALLRIVIFKSSLTLNNQLRNVKACQVEAHELLRWLVTIESDLEKILGDVAQGLADPAGRDQLLAVRDELHQGVQSVLGGLTPGSSTPAVEQWLRIPTTLKKVTGVCK